MRAHLITIPFSHFCEKARWALDRRGIAFTEEAHLPMLHTRHTRAWGGRSTPLLVVDEGARVLPDSTDILRWADEVGTRGAPLFPPGDDEVVALEARFDDVLGPHARRLGYFELFKSMPALRALVARSTVPSWERALGATMMPAFKLILSRALKVNAAGAARSEARVREVFDDVDRRLSDGRRFLCGDHFTAADLTFAALAGPLVVPPALERYLLPLDELPADFRAAVARWRSTRAGAYAVGLYERERFT